MSNSNITDMLKNFRDLQELQAFAEQQHITIMELTKKIENLNVKNKHLEDMLQERTPALVGEYKPLVVATTVDEAHEETICRMELKKLHDLSVERALTYEETKKVEIYTKLMLSLKQKPKVSSNDMKNRSTAELLKLVKDSGTDE